MSIRLESTVAQVAEALAKAGASADQRVVVTVLDDDEAAKLAALRRLIDDGLASGPTMDGAAVFARLRRMLAETHPDLNDGAA